MATFVGSTGRDLLLELQRGDRSSGNNNNNGSRGGQAVDLPTYNNKLVRAAFEELQDAVRGLSAEVQAAEQIAAFREQQDGNDDASSGKQPPKLEMHVRPSLLLHNATIQRQKRCLLTYHKVRMDRIRHQIVMGDGMPSNPTNSKSTDASTAVSEQPLSEAELQFAQNYQQLRMQYAAAMDVELDMLPPTSHMIQVRVIIDQGDIVLESGRTVRLSRGSIHFVPRSDVLPFLRAGTLELVDGEEVDM